MSGEDFYITLPSNAATNSSSTAFRITLPRTVRLTGEWEVALVELIYPYSWYNVDVTERLYLGLETQTEETRNDLKGILMRNLRKGHYSTVSELLSAIIEDIPQEFRDKIFLEHDAKTDRVEIIVKPPLVGLHLPRFLLYMLGYAIGDSQATVDDGGTISHAPVPYQNMGIAPHPPDMRAGLSMFYVYCDLVEHSIVGNKLVPLLREVAVDGKFGDVIDKIFTHPYYIPVLRKEFDGIEIAIKTDQNKPLALQYGKTLVKLHFRRRPRSGILI